jgi:hypothetical protein
MAEERTPRLEDQLPVTVIEQFAGMVTNRGVLFGPPGSAEWQENLRVASEGRLEGRSGLRVVSWEN